MPVFWLLFARDMIAISVAMMAAPFEAMHVAVERELERQGVDA